MTPRSFWAILIKLSGVYIFFEFLDTIPQFLTQVTQFTYLPHGSEDMNAALMMITYFTFSTGLYLLILWGCVFKANWIIDILKLDRGFTEERFEFTMHRSTILKIVIMVLGGVMLADYFPVLCKGIFNAYQQSYIYGGFKKNPQSAYLIMYFLKALIGYFMFTCSRLIVNYIELKTRKPLADQ